MKRPLELYIHIPFCVRKCLYCDFLSQPASEMARHAYVEQLLEEIERESRFCQDYSVVSVFLGGGTPSVLAAEDIRAILCMVRRCFCLESDAEITIETNPGTANLEKLKAFLDCGINRISLGLQSADNRELKLLGRIHTFEDFLKTYQRVRVAGFSNVNVDLMSSLPGQTLASWKSTLRQVVMLRPEHISAYSLMIEEGTPFYGKYHDHPEMLPSEEEDRAMYYAARQILEEHGLKRYEISNYALPGRECRHNVGYWTGVEYLGLGLGASSYLHGFRFRNEADLEAYRKIDMKADDADLRLHQDITELSEKDRMEEFMFLGLRMTRGVSGSEFLRRFGQNMWNVYGKVLPGLQENKLIEVESPFIRLTDFGIDISNYVLSEFLFDR